MTRRVRSRPTAGRRRRSPVAPVFPKPPIKRSALLGSTALAAGVLVALGGFVSMPRPALADVAPGRELQRSDECMDLRRARDGQLFFHAGRRFLHSFRAGRPVRFDLEWPGGKRRG